MPASRDSPVGVGTYLVFFPLHGLRTSHTSGEDAFRSFTEDRELRPASSRKGGLSPLPSCRLSGKRIAPVSRNDDKTAIALSFRRQADLRRTAVAAIPGPKAVGNTFRPMLKE